MGNYFGKLSLDEAVNDHKRMVRLYDTAAKRYEFEDGKEEVIRNLAKDCLSENARWYAYMGRNKPEISL